MEAWGTKISFEKTTFKVVPNSLPKRFDIHLQYEEHAKEDYNGYVDKSAWEKGSSKKEGIVV